MFDVILRATTTTEEWLMMDLRATREAYGDGTIAVVGWISSKQNVADELSKSKPNDAMKKYMRTG